MSSIFARFLIRMGFKNEEIIVENSLYKINVDAISADTLSNQCCTLYSIDIKELNKLISLILNKQDITLSLINRKPITISMLKYFTLNEKIAYAQISIFVDNVKELNKLIESNELILAPELKHDIDKISVVLENINNINQLK